MADVEKTDGVATRSLEALRGLDRDRYLACLLSPDRVRRDLAALYLFNAEIARIRDVVSEPMAGEIRMQWWRDALQSEKATTGNPAADALLETIAANGLPKAAFDRMIEARLFDLYDDPMPDRATLEGYAGETASTIVQCAVLICDRDRAEALAASAGHAGVAQTVAGLLLLMPIHARRGQVYVPGDILASCGVDRDTFLQAPYSRAVRAVHEALIALGSEHLNAARTLAKGKLARSALPAYLPVALCGQVFAAARNNLDADPRTNAPSSPQWRRQLRLAFASFFGTF